MYLIHHVHLVGILKRYLLAQQLSTSQQVPCSMESVIWPRYNCRNSYDLHTKSDVSCSIVCY